MNRKKSRTTPDTPRSRNRSGNHSRNRSKTRCNFQFADGRRCRMLLHKTTGQLCLFHHRELLQLQSSAEIGAELLALGGNFRNPIAINFVLGKLFSHVATGRMHRRDASTLAYIAQLLLQTLDQKRYNLARDQYDYRGFTKAVDAKYGRPKPRKRRTRTSTSTAPNAAPPSDPQGTPISRLASSATATQTAPTSTNPNAGERTAQTSDAIRAHYPPPANPEFPDALPDTPWLRQLVLDRRAANGNHDANHPAEQPPRL